MPEDNPLTYGEPRGMEAGSEPWRTQWFRPSAPGSVVQSVLDWRPVTRDPNAPIQIPQLPPEMDADGGMNAWLDAQAAREAAGGEAVVDRNPDFREAGGLSVPAGSSVAQAARRDLFGGQPASPVNPALAQAGLAAILSPGAIGRRLEQLDEAVKDTEASYSEQERMLTRRTETRAALQAEALQALADYREGLAATRPAKPALKGLPAAPDLKIRPWLDPEGKDALSVIAQTLGMMATGIAGIVQKAPLTAIKQFRLAAEDWRRDEIDAAAGKWQTFQATVAQIKGENEQALQLYEIADKEYGANQTAKRAALITRLDALGLHDSATQAAALPYDLARQKNQGMLDNSLKILNAIEKYGAVVSKWQTAGAKYPKSLGEAIGIFQGLTEAIPGEQDPERKAAMLAQRDVAQAWVLQYQKLRLEDARERSGMGVARTQLPKLDNQLRQLTSFMGDVVRLDDAVNVLAKAGMLPSSPTPIAEWFVGVKRKFPFAWTPATEAAYQTVQQLVPQLIVTYERTVENMIGPRFRDAFAIPHNAANLSANQFRGLIDMLDQGAQRARPLYEERKKLLMQILPSVSPDTAGADEDTEEPE